MSGKKEKWEERNGRWEKWRESEKLGCLVGGKNGEKRKVGAQKKYVGPTKNESPQIGEKKWEKFWLVLTKLTLKLASLIPYEYTLIYIYIWLCLKSMMSFEVIGSSLKI